MSKMTAKLNVIMFMGSMREQRICQRVATFMKKQLEETNHNVEVFDPLKMKFELLQTPLHFYRDQSQAPTWLIEANEKIKAADAFVIVSPEYNCTIPPVLTNMLDHFPPASYSYRPTGMVVYSAGSFGGTRSAVAMRPFLAELSTVAVPFSFGIPRAHDSIDPEGNPVNEHMVPNAKKLIGMLDWFAHAMKNQKEAVGLPGK